MNFWSRYTSETSTPSKYKKSEGLPKSTTDNESFNKEDGGEKASPLKVSENFGHKNGV